MKFPLLIEARVSHVKESCKVPLGKGRWRITANHINSWLSVVNGELHPLPQGGEVIIEGPAVVYIVINKAGDEARVNAFAELITNDVSPS